MQFDGEYLVPVAPDTVWDGLVDPDILRRSIPGCTAMEKTGDTEYTATIVARVGPVSATFKGKVELADQEPPRAFTLKGRGQGGPAGFAKGAAHITLSPEGDQTRLTYRAEAEVGGKLASVGARMIQGVARKMADDFFARFAEVLTGPPEAAPAEAAPSGRAPAAAPVAGRHIPLIDRVAWALAGFGLGVIVALLWG